jgi:transcriptional/translational regulatory protein YebC/TACO1
MAGHNKWSKIRHKKGAKDSKRAVMLGKASRSITAASKDCNGDVSNLRLQAAVAHAKAVQLPKDRIEEAIEKGTAAYRSKKGGDDFVNLRYDAMMRLVLDETEETTAQVACIITALSDNRNRTTQHVRHLVSKAGGELLPTDNLNYLFQQVGVILVEKSQETNQSDSDFEEALMECALEGGAIINVEELVEDDDEEEENNDTTKRRKDQKTFVVTTEEKELWQVVHNLQQQRDGGVSSFHITQFQHEYILQDEENGGVKLSTKAWQDLHGFIEQLEENEDVSRVFHNAS